MVSKLRLCRATQSARASASATVPIASTRTASYSPKIKVDVIGSKPSGSPKGFGRSPTIAFPGAVNTLTPSVLDVMEAIIRGVSLVSSRTSFLCLKVGRVPIQSLVRGRALTVFQVGALSHFDNVTVGIADVAANLAVLRYRLCDELRSATSP